MYGPQFYIDYIRHFLVSHSRHGTHSPFVYRLVDEVIYAPVCKEEPRDKVERLVGRLIRRFNPRTIFRTGDPLPLQPLDFVITRNMDADTLAVQLQEFWLQLHPNSVLVVNGIYRTRKMKELWRTVQELTDVTVTIDLFYVGLVFFRTGQAKENFRIRF